MATQMESFSISLLLLTVASAAWLRAESSTRTHEKQTYHIRSREQGWQVEREGGGRGWVLEIIPEIGHGDAQNNIH